MPFPDRDFTALIVGASGFVGRRMYAALGSQRSVATYYRREVDGGVRFDAQSDRLIEVLEASARRISHVFILYGAIDMEGCARDPVGTAKVNVDSVRRMVDDTIRYGALPVYASTDYIFDGSRGAWSEDDPARPVMAYGRQKLDVETYLRSLDAPWLAARFSKVVSGELGTHSMLGQWVGDIKAGRVHRCAHDQVFSPAFVDDVAAAMLKLALSGRRGLFNLAGPAAYSRLDLLRLLVENVRALRPEIEPEIVPVRLHDLPFLEKRPLDTSLDTARLKAAIDHNFVAMPALCAAVAREHFG